ncbi:unnamed protein product, partial [marine sediment metagenome]
MLTSLGPHMPEIKLAADPVFHLFGFPVGNGVIAVWITIIFLVGFSYLFTRRMKVIPGRLQAIFEFMPLWVYSICRSVAGEENVRRVFPIAATIFAFVGFNAWLSLLPGFESIVVHTAEGEVPLIRPANTDINMPLALALVSIGIVQFYIIKGLGVRKGIGALVGLIEGAVGFIDVVSLTFR